VISANATKEDTGMARNIASRDTRGVSAEPRPRNIGIGLARVTVAAPHHRMDVALPEHVALAELLPGLLHSAGADLADAGQRHGGWVLRRADASALDPSRTLASQNVLDGEILYLVPRRTAWPEPEIDDLVDAIAMENRKHAPAWSHRTTRLFGLGSACVLLLALLGSLVALGRPWHPQAAIAVAIAAVLLMAGTLLSRALSDVGAGAVLALVALAYSAVGSAMIAAGDSGVGSWRAPELIAFCGGLIAASVIADLGVGSDSPYFIGAFATGLLGVTGAVLNMLGLAPAEVAAIVASAIVVFAPAFPLLSLRLAKLPTPNLPVSAEDLLKEEELPIRPAIAARVVRSDQMLTGILMAASIALVTCQVVLVASRDTGSTVLAVLIATSALLRARLYPTLRHRLPQLLAGLGGVIALGGTAFALDRSTAITTLTAAAVSLAATAVAAGLVYSSRRAQPVLARLGDVAEVLAVVSIVPVACGVLGVYSHIRGLAG
jgi:type VII secretion integral membrane protein EccD